jgi:hypothetical protein
MRLNKAYFRWTSLHLLVFLLTPLSFALAGLLAGALVSMESHFFSTLTPLALRLQVLYNQGIYLLSPLVSGALLGVLLSLLQYSTIRKSLPGFRPLSWIPLGTLGMALAFPAFAWASSSHIQLVPINQIHPLLLASFFSACVYGLVGALPQSRLLRSNHPASTGWFIASTLAALLSFALICSPAWLPEGAPYFWLTFLLCISGGLLFGLITGVPALRWAEDKTMSLSRHQE